MTEGQIEPPDDPREKVTLLPDDQKPYGDQCPLDRKVQSLLFHYGVPVEDVDLLASNGIRQFRHLCVDPDSVDFKLISGLFTSVGSLSLVTQVFRRAGQRPDWKESCFPISSILRPLASSTISGIVPISTPSSSDLTSSIISPTEHEATASAVTSDIPVQDKVDPPNIVNKDIVAVNEDKCNRWTKIDKAVCDTAMETGMQPVRWPVQSPSVDAFGPLTSMWLRCH